MEKKLVILLFLTGIVPLVQSIPHNFSLIQLKKTWTEAQTYCRTKNSDLVTIETPADMIQLQAEAQDHKFSDKAWIGLYKVFIDWRWSFKNESLGSQRLWKSGQPDDEKKECAVMNQNKWEEKPCKDTHKFMCYDERLVGDDRYIYYDIKKTWYEAQSFCRERHSDLVTIRDAAEYLIIKAKILSDVWIGLYRNSWNWSDQTNFSNITWDSGQPHEDQQKKCVYVKNGKAFNEKCSDLLPFFCYSVEVTGQQQVIRMKVQSDQDLNDPAVQAVILEQIQQNLKHHGIANVTVKFRKQPGGAVFHKLEEKKTAV